MGVTASVLQQGEAVVEGTASVLQDGGVATSSWCSPLAVPFPRFLLSSAGSVSGSVIVVDGDPWGLKIDGDTMRIEKGNSYMVFKRTELLPAD